MIMWKFIVGLEFQFFSWVFEFLSFFALRFFLAGGQKKCWRNWQYKAHYGYSNKNDVTIDSHMLRQNHMSGILAKLPDYNLWVFVLT